MKKKSKSMYLVLTLLLLLVAGFTTYAIYKTSASGTANVSAANWVVKVIANNTTTNVTGGANSISLGTCPNLLAPGSSCTIPFIVDMTESEVDSILTVGIGNGINQDTLALMNEAGLSLKISDGTLEGYAYTLNYGTTKQLNLVIDWEAGSEDDDNKASADVALSKTVGTLTIPVNMTVRQFNGLKRTVTFNKNTEDSNIETPASVQVTDGGTISTIPDLNSENLIFVGWYTSPTGGAKLTSSTPIIDDVTYYARWRNRRNMTVTFNTHGGSEVSPISVGEGKTISSLPKSLKGGYELVGWFTEEEGGTALTTLTTINSDITYHARWQEKTFNMADLVYFDPTSSSTVCSDETIDTNVSTCMTWRVLSTSENNVTLQLTSDLLASTSYTTASSYPASQGPDALLASLASATSGWKNVDYLTNYSYTYYSYNSMSCTNGTCTISSNTVYNVRARAITAEEIRAINNNSTTNLPSWLLENISSNGYWTLSGDPSGSYGNTIYKVGSNGKLVGQMGSRAYTCPARPVITIPKTKIK